MSTLLYYRGRVAAAELLRAAGVKEGDLVAIQAFTCSAVPEAVMSLGASPLYVDISSSHLNMSLASFRECIEASPVKPSAVIVQFTFGSSCEVAAVAEHARELGIRVIEDRCHHDYYSTATQPSRDVVGAFYSFEWGKSNVAGLGGAAVTAHTEVANALKVRWQTFQQPSLRREMVMIIKLLVFSLTSIPSLRRYIKKAYRYLVSRNLINGNHTLSYSAEYSEYSFKMTRVSRCLLCVKRFLWNDSKATSVLGVHLFDINVKSFYRSAVADGDEYCLLRLPLWVSNKASVVSQLEVASLDISAMYETVVQPVTGADLPRVGYQAGSCPNAELATANVVSVKFRDGDDIAPILRMEEASGGQ